MSFDSFGSDWISFKCADIDSGRSKNTPIGVNFAMEHLEIKICNELICAQVVTLKVVYCTEKAHKLGKCNKNIFAHMVYIL